MNATADALFESLDAPDQAEDAPPTQDAAAAPEAQPKTPDAPAADGASPPAREPPAADVASAAPAEPQAQQPPAAAEPPEKMVPLSALEQERRTLRARIQALESQVSQVKPAEAPAKPAEPEAPVPDYLDDPKGYTDAQAKRLESAIKKLETGGTQQLEAQQRELGELRLQQGLLNAEAAAVAEAPDFMDALTHVRGVRAQQLQALNPGATEDQIINAIRLEEKGIAAAELAQGRNPYLTMHRIAKTFGYQPKSAAGAEPAKPAASSTQITAALKEKGQLPPDLTLGKTGGAPPGDPSGADEEGGVDEVLQAAFSERFGRRRA